MGVINARLKENIDVLNHPEALGEILTNISLVWAVLFVVVGCLCISNGYRWHKIIIVVLAGMAGAWAGTMVGGAVGDTTVAAVCLAALGAIIAWPLLRYSVALFGGIAGAFCGANVWTALGFDATQHSMGAVIGLVVMGLLAFTAFRIVVVLLTSMTGSTLLVLGGLALLLQIGNWHEAVLSSLANKPLIVPILVASAATVGAVMQLGGGVKGLNAMADKADPVKAKKPAKAA